MTAGVRGKGRPSLTEAAEIDRAIRAAALKVLLDQGEGATMQAVAAAAGLSRKSLYARYPNKSALFLEVIGELLRNTGGLRFAAEGTIAERLQNYVEAALKVIAQPDSQTLRRMLTMDTAYAAPLRAETFHATRRIFFDPLVALLAEAGRRGELTVEDAEATARLVIRLIITESMIVHEEGAGWLATDPSEDYAAFLTRTITRGLLPR